MSTPVSSVLPASTDLIAINIVSEDLLDRKDTIIRSAPTLPMIINAMTAIKDRRIQELNVKIKYLHCKVKKWNKTINFSYLGMLVSILSTIGVLVKPAYNSFKNRRFETLDNDSVLGSSIGTGFFVASILANIYFSFKLDQTKRNLRIARNHLAIMHKYNKEIFTHEAAHHYMSQSTSMISLDLTQLEKYMENSTNVNRIVSIINNKEEERALCQIDRVMKAILQLPEAFELFNEVQRRGKVTIAPTRELISKQFGARWISNSREILIQINKCNHDGPLIFLILFEMHNACADQTLLDLIDRASKRDLDKESYVKEIEILEYGSELQTASLVDKGIAKGLFPHCARRLHFKNFDDHYRYQQISGHSAQIADAYNSIRPDLCMEPFIGTIPMLSSLSTKEKEDLRLYLSIKYLLESSDPEENNKGKELLTKELQQLDRKNETYDEPQAQQKELLLRLIFQNNSEVLGLINRR